MLGESLRLCCRGAAKDAAKTALKQNSQFITRIVIVGVGGKKKQKKTAGNPVVPSHLVVEQAILLFFSLPRYRFVLRR